MQVYESMVIPVPMYDMECRAMRMDDELGRILHIFRPQHTRNDDIRRRAGMQVATVDRINARRL